MQVRPLRCPQQSAELQPRESFSGTETGVGGQGGGSGQYSRKAGYSRLVQVLNRPTEVLLPVEVELVSE